MQPSNVSGINEDQDRGPEVSTEQMSTDQKLNILAEMVSKFDKAPDIADLYGWKERHGKIFVATIHGDEIFIFRTIKRNEYKEMAANGLLEKPISTQDAVIRKTLLWPKPDAIFMSTSDAGVIDTIFECVMYSSGFVSKQQALSMVDRI